MALTLRPATEMTWSRWREATSARWSSLKALLTLNVTSIRRSPRRNERVVFDFCTPRSWNPNYRPLLPFTQLEMLSIKLACDVDCSLMVGDNMITDLVRAMPRLKTLRLGDMPCEASTGITIKGLTALACHCRHLSELHIHFWADTIVEAVTRQETPSFPDAVAMLHSDCALTLLEVGRIPIPETGTAGGCRGSDPHFPSCSPGDSWRNEG